jgi:tetratricopeptide (TPR) repeat protein
VTRMTCAAFAAAVILSIAPARADDGDTCGHSELGQPAIDACTRQIESGNLSADDREVAFVYRGMAYHKLGQHDRAIQDFDEAIRLKPDDAYAFYFRGSDYFALDQYARAIQDYDEAIRLKPDYAYGFYSRGLAEKMMGNTEAAAADLAKAKTIDPDVDQ